MKSLKHKLIYALVTLIIFVFVGLGLLIGQLFKTYYVNSFNNQFQKEGSLLATLIEDAGGISVISAEKLQIANESLQSRITIINNQDQIDYDEGDVHNQSSSKHDQAIREIINQSDIKDSGILPFEYGFDVSYYWENIYANNQKEGILILSSNVNELNSAYQKIWIILLVSLILAFIIILYIGSRIMTRYTKPIESATETAIELAKGNYRARTYEDNYYEFGKLSSSINILARNLQHITLEQEIQTERLTTLIENMGSGLVLIDDKGYVILINRTFKEIFHVEDAELLGYSYSDVISHKEVQGLIHDVFMTEERVRRQVALQIGIHLKNFEIYGAPILSVHNEWKGIVVVFHDITELKRLEQIRKDFVANVSHELKTPVTSIKGFAETLMDGAGKDEQTLEAFLNIILKESDRLQSIISDLLELSRIEQYGFSIKLEKVNITEIIENIIKVLSNKADSKFIKIILDINKPTAYVEGEALRIKQIFINLISNALAYTPENGQVKITIREENHRVKVSVEDNGIGIHKNEIPRVFERFYRVDKDRSRNSGGTGLGLAIVKHLIEAHHGEIEVESEVGKGSTFIVTLRKSFDISNGRK